MTKKRKKKKTPFVGMTESEYREREKLEKKLESEANRKLATEYDSKIGSPVVSNWFPSPATGNLFKGPTKAKFTPPTTKWYFGYGSNMSRKRMSKRGVFWTSAKRGTLNGYLLRFNKKAGPKGLGYANITKSSGHRVEGILYRVEDVMDARTLDMYEGHPHHYVRVEKEIETKTGPVKAFVYIALKSMTEKGLKPTKEYKNYLLEGKKHLSPEYWKWLKSIKTAKNEEMPLRVFVYGTLKKGFGNHRLCSTATSVDSALLEGRLYETGLPYVHVDDGNIWVTGSGSVSKDFKAMEELNALVRNEPFTKPTNKNCVIGELVTFKDWSMLDRLDRLEGFRPNASSHYTRVLSTCWVGIEDPKEVSCWVYVIDENERCLTEHDRNFTGEFKGFNNIKVEKVAKPKNVSLPELDTEPVDDVLGDRFYYTSTIKTAEEEEEEIKNSYPELYADENPYHPSLIENAKKGNHG